MPLKDSPQNTFRSLSSLRPEMHRSTQKGPCHPQKRYRKAFLPQLERHQSNMLQSGLLTAGSHYAPHDLRRTCAKLCHDSGGELEQIQFLLGHASVQTTEHYLGCKQNLGHPVNDLFDLKTIAPMNRGQVRLVQATNAAESVEKASPPEIECSHGGAEDEQPICEPTQASVPERTDLVEIRKDHCPQSLRRCSGSGASRCDSENKANGERHPAVIGFMGFGKGPDPTS